jgi:hypothetical protein
LLGTLKRRIYMLLRSKGSRNWPKYVDLIVNHMNASKNKALGGLRPNNIKTVSDDYKVKKRLEEIGKPLILPNTMTVQKQLLEDFNSDPSNAKFKVGKYVFLDLAKGGYGDKAYDYQISIFHILVA